MSTVKHILDDHHILISEELIELANCRHREEPPQEQSNGVDWFGVRNPQSVFQKEAIQKNQFSGDDEEQNSEKSLPI
jgi:hypothetical protein